MESLRRKNIYHARPWKNKEANSLWSRSSSVTRRVELELGVPHRRFLIAPQHLDPRAVEEAHQDGFVLTAPGAIEKPVPELREDRHRHEQVLD